MTGGTELEQVVTIAQAAGQQVLEHFERGDFDTRDKGVRDVVTAADLASERYVAEQLRELFPADGIVGEEGAAERAASTRRWYIDPLDGTLNYSRGLPVWCISLALFDGPEPLVGAVYDPIRREMFAAERGQGAYCNNNRIRTSAIEVLDRALVHLTVDFRDDSMVLGLDDLQRVAPRVLRTRNIGSAALALAYVGAGRFDAMLHRFAQPWDYGAGALVVLEAGGHITDMDGSPYSDATASVLAAASPALHASLSTLIGTEDVSPLQ